MTEDDQYKTFEFVIRYYLIVNRVRLKEPLSKEKEHIFGKKFLSMYAIALENYSQKYDTLKNQVKGIKDATINNVLGFSTIHYFENGQQYVKFITSKNSIMSIEKTKTAIRSLKGIEKYDL